VVPRFFLLHQKTCGYQQDQNGRTKQQQNNNKKRIVKPLTASVKVGKKIATVNKP